MVTFFLTWINLACTTALPFGRTASINTYNFFYNENIIVPTKTIFLFYPETRDS